MHAATPKTAGVIARYLAHMFGVEYAQYAHQARRWL